MHILIPMAGKGKQFLEAGYRTHHTVLPTYNRHNGRKMPMVVCAAMDLPGIEDYGKNITFLDRDFHRDSGVEETIKRYFPGASFITSDHLTDGQASTCLLAEETIEKSEELLIAGADTGMVYDIDSFRGLCHECDAIVFTYRHNESVKRDPDSYGWMKVDENNNIIDVSVKKRISNTPTEDHAVVSTFWFKKGGDFFKAAKEMIHDNDRVNGEFYVDQAIKYILNMGLRVKVFEIKRYIGWNSPFDYEDYQLSFDYWISFLNRIDNDVHVIPFTIGIAGDSGSGKSTFLPIVKHVTGEENVLILEGDGDHKWERESEEWNRYTHLNIEANNIYRQADNLQMLKNGATIKRREYDHETGKFTEEHRYNPKPYIAMCGLHSFYLPQNRRNLDLKIFMDADENLRRLWKLKRDVNERGHRIEDVVKQIKKRGKDASIYVNPQREYADLIIHYSAPDLNDYMDIEYKGDVNVIIELNKEDTICGLIYRFMEWISREIEWVKCKSSSIIFNENEVENLEIPVLRVMQELGIDSECFGITNKTSLYGREGILALILIVYIAERRRNSEKRYLID